MPPEQRFSSSWTTDTVFNRTSADPACRLLDSLLDNDLLLLRINSALRRLRRNRYNGFAGRQRRREVMECAVVCKHRAFPAIHHHSGPSLGVSLSKNCGAVFFPPPRLFSRRLVGLPYPVICAFPEAGNRDIRGVYFLV